VHDKNLLRNRRRVAQTDDLSSITLRLLPHRKSRYDNLPIRKVIDGSKKSPDGDRAEKSPGYPIPSWGCDDYFVRKE